MDITANKFRNFHAPVEISDHAAGEATCAHRHLGAYAAIVLEGEYCETSADGVFCAADGDIVIHPPFHFHANVFNNRRTRVLNVSLPFERAFAIDYCVLDRIGVCNAADLASENAESAASAILNAAEASPFAAKRSDITNAIDAAGAELRSEEEPRVNDVARRAGLSLAYFSRAFHARYGMTAAEYRAEHRFRRALRALARKPSLAETAHQAGYADQAHMTRDFRRRAGATPARLLRQVKFVQDGERPY